jgi:hypothetical protein
MSAVSCFVRSQGPALLALFVALSGTAYATGFPANVVASKQLQRDAVTRPKLAGGAVTGAKVARDSVTGKALVEATLGTVPAAARADSAANVTSATDATTAVNATNTASASTAADSTRVAGLSAGDLELHLDRTCSGGFAQFNGQCSFPVSGVKVVTSNALQVSSDQVVIEVACHLAGKVELTIGTKLSSGPWSLAWFFGDGTTVSADSASLVGGSSQTFPFAGKRIEGQFILSRAGTVTTHKVHLVDLGTVCEFQDLSLAAG